MRANHLKYYLILCATTLFFLGPFFRVSIAISQILPFKNHTTKDGLVSNTVRALYQDSKGYLWIGTIDGLNVYDGYSFKLYTTRDGLPSNAIRCFLESRYTQGLMWIGTNEGVSRLYQGKFSNFRMGNTPISNYVNAFLEDSYGVLWCATDRGIFRICGERVETFIPDTSDFSSQSIVEMSSNFILFGCNLGLYLYDRKEISFQKIDIDYAHNPKIAGMLLLHENDTTLWVASNDCRLKKIVNLNLVNEWKVPATLFHFLIKGNKDNLWIGTSSGLFEIRGQNKSKLTIFQYTTKNGLLGEQIRAGIIDKENNLWLGVFGRSLSKLIDQNIFRFPYKWSEYLIFGEDRLVVDRDDHFWVLEEVNNLNEIWRDLDGTWQRATHNIPGEGKNQLMRGAFIDRHGKFWLMYADGVLRCYEIVSSGDASSTLKYIFSFDPRLFFPSVWPLRILIDRNNLLWYSFNGLGVAVFDLEKNKLLKLYSKTDAPPYKNVTYLCEDKDGNIWFTGYDWGVLKLHGGFYGNGKTNLYNSTNKLPGNSIHYINSDSHNRIWIGTFTTGVCMISDTTTITLSMMDGLPSNWITTIKEDPVGNMWIGTFAGLAKANVQNIYQVEIVDGLQGELIHSCKISTNGLVGIATENAFVVIDANKSQIDPCPPPIYLTGFNVDGKHVEHDGRGIEFSHTQTYFMIDYTGISLKFENDLLYQYKLEGIDTDWQPPTKERKVIFAALGPGEYTFKVKAINPRGIESVQPAIVHFTIRPPFYQQWWFIALGSVSIIIGIIGYIRHRISIVRQEQLAHQEFSRKLIDSQEQERKRIAAELHDSVGQNLLIIKNRALLGLETCPPDQLAIKELQTISSISSQTIDEVREISYNLRPYQLDRLSLTSAIKSLINRIKDSFDLNISINAALIDNLFTKESEIIIYRIIQEGLNNVVKHATASIVKVTIEKAKSHISIVIEDNGKGFDVDSTLASKEGFGLKGITERVRILNGTFSIISSPEKGTTLSISIPHHGERDEK